MPPGDEQSADDGTDVETSGPTPAVEEEPENDGRVWEKAAGVWAAGLLETYLLARGRNRQVGDDGT